jgi:tetratricopeptide (TPR) repeat protein
MSVDNLRERLQALHKNLHTLEEREAKYGLDVPLSLINQIEDHRKAIHLVGQAIRGDLSDEDLAEQLAPLNLALDGSVQNIFQSFQTIPKFFLIGALVIGSIIVALLFLIPPQAQPLAPKPTSTPLAVTPAKTDEILVLVAKFRSSGDQSVNAGQRIHRQIEAEREDKKLDARVELIHQINDVNEAREVGQVYNATIVIWGWTDDVAIFPNFSIRDPNLRNPTVPEKPVDLEDFWLFVSYELPAQMTFFTEFTIGQIYFRNKDYQEADRVIKLALENQPADIPADALANVYFYLGFTSHNLGNLEDALEGYEQATALAPSLYQAHFNRGVAHQSQGLVEESIKDFSLAIDLKPDLTNAYINRGDSYRKLGQLDGSLADFDHALELDPGSVDALFNRGTVYHKLGDYESALTDTSRALELLSTSSPRYLPAVLNRAHIYKTMENYDGALADYQHVIGMTSQSDIFHLSAQSGLGLIYYLKGDYQSAIEINQAALASNQDIGPDQLQYSELLEIRYNLALALLADGQDSQAKTEYETALSLTTNPVNIEEAIDDLETLLTTHPETPGAVEILEELRAYEPQLESLE